MVPRKARIFSLIAALTLLFSALLAGSAGNASAEASSAEVAAASHLAAADAEAARVGKVGFFVFNTNPRDPSKSRLTWHEFRTFPDGRPPKLIVKKGWRAGSGDGSTDTCLKNHGWLPGGWYGGTFKPGFDGDINGLVWHLDNKRCGRGTLRSALFIHSEMTPSGGQNCGLEPECWDGATDYLSEGCIKVKPSHIKQAAELYRAFYGKRAGTYKKKLLLVI